MNNILHIPEKRRLTDLEAKDCAFALLEYVESKHDTCAVCDLSHECDNCGSSYPKLLKYTGVKTILDAVITSVVGAED